MTILPIRNLGKIGVITDIDAVDLPPEALTSARNVRFDNGRITNAHVWREALNSPSSPPSFLFSNSNDKDAAILGYVSKTGRVFHIVNGDEIELTNITYTPLETSAPITFCYLQGVYYVNQADRVPWYKPVTYPAITYNFWGAETYQSIGNKTYSETAQGTDKYTSLTNWNANDRCQVLRAYKDVLVALNVTKNGTSFPNMVKWSNIAQYGDVPDSWDPADLTKSAGENTLAEVQTAILDGLPLRNSFVVYAADQAWAMEYTQGADVFQFFKLFGNRGIVNTNCVIEVDGMHYVFDSDDIYIHDGVSPPKSICDNRVRNHIFRNIDMTKYTKFFVYHNRPTSEAWFCFNSKVSDLKWAGELCDNCNYAAVYNYTEDTWTFHDLPNVTGMASVIWNKETQFSDFQSLQYGQAGASYADSMLNYSKAVFAPSILTESISSNRIVMVDNGLVPAFAFPATDDLAVKPFVERIGLDLDEVIPELRAYKNYKSIYPQVSVKDTSAPINFKFGGSDNPQQEIDWDALQSFEATTDYKIDTRARGRYLSWYFEGDNRNSYTLSGFDLDVASPSRR